MLTNEMEYKQKDFQLLHESFNQYYYFQIINV
jgi:hypothetical protein